MMMSVQIFQSFFNGSFSESGAHRICSEPREDFAGEVVDHNIDVLFNLVCSQKGRNIRVPDLMGSFRVHSPPVPFFLRRVLFLSVRYHPPKLVQRLVHSY